MSKIKESFNNLNLGKYNQYKYLYKKSIEEPNEFWSEVSEQFYWKISAEDILNYNFDIRKGHIYIKWLEGASTNICYNVLDRIIDKGMGDRIAYYWESNDGMTKRTITYYQLKEQVCQLSNALISLNVRKGDRIAIYMPVSIEVVIAMLSSARIGAIHMVVFAGFSAEALSERIIMSRCTLLITSNACFRGDKIIPLKQIADSAMHICQRSGYKNIKKIIFKHLDLNITSKINLKEICPFDPQTDIFWDQIMENQLKECEPVWMNAEDPLFIIYTSGSTGKPKGMVHTIGGYLLNSFLTFKYVFGYTDGDIFFSTADIGWITAHTFSVYGSLANGASIVLMEGTPFYPKEDRIWEIIERLGVNILYTAPTVIRTSMLLGDHHLNQHKRTSLKTLGTAGEPINSEAFLWYQNIVGEKRCSVVDTYWQTETGAPMLALLPGCLPQKPGSVGLPFFGVIPAILDKNGMEMDDTVSGHLVFCNPWPAIARTIDGRHDVYEKTYFEKFPRYYFTGDWAKRDSDGYYWINGRTDEALNVSGHLLSTVEVEKALYEHKSVAETAVVSAPHPLKGEVLCVFVVLHSGYYLTPELIISLKCAVRNRIGSFAQPEYIHVVNDLPKTKSGKIMRRLLYKIVRNDRNFEDISTLSNSTVLDELFTKLNLINK